MSYKDADLTYLKANLLNTARIFRVKALNLYDELDYLTHPYQQIARYLEYLSIYFIECESLNLHASVEKIVRDILDFFEQHIDLATTGGYSRIRELPALRDQQDAVFFSRHTDAAERFRYLKTWQYFLASQKDALGKAASLDEFEIVGYEISNSEPPDILQQANDLHKAIFQNWMCTSNPGRQLDISLVNLSGQSPLSNYPSRFHVLLRSETPLQQWKRADVEVQKSRECARPPREVPGIINTVASFLLPRRSPQPVEIPSLSERPESLCSSPQGCLCKVVQGLVPCRMRLKITSTNETQGTTRLSLAIEGSSLEKSKLTDQKVLTLADLSRDFKGLRNHSWRQDLNRLACILALAFMQLYDDPDGPSFWICKNWSKPSTMADTKEYWRDPRWTSRIRLLQNTNMLPDILHPYLLAQECFQSSPVFDEEKAQELLHGFPSLLDLGIALLRIKLIALGDVDIVLEPTIGGKDELNVNSQLTAAQEVLDKLLEDEGQHINYYLKAVAACFDPIQQGLDDKAKQPQIREFIFREVVLPLKIHFGLATPTDEMVRAIADGKSLADTLQEIDSAHDVEEIGNENQKLQPTHFERDCKSSLFDGRNTEVQLSQFTSAADTWFARLHDFTHSYNQKHKDQQPNCVKVAIIDTGISGNVPELAAGWKQFHTIRNLVDVCAKGIDVYTRGKKSEFEGVRIDEHGHGTHMAMLVHQMAPHADLFVAKVTKDGQRDNERLSDIVAEAIKWAIESGVHIISMSLGIEDRSKKLVNAIYEAKERCILFAAASNCGGNGSVAWPACLPGVFSINSTDELGNKSGFNPSPSNDRHNFSTLGAGINCGGTCKSGTSYATPVAAGFAASVLEFCSGNEGLRHYRPRLQNFTNMEAVFLAISVERDGYRYIDPLRFWQPEDKRLSTADVIRTALKD